MHANNGNVVTGERMVVDGADREPSVPDTQSTATTRSIEIATSVPETFDSLCKELRARMKSGAENALICHRAYLAYNAEHPETTQGKGNSSDRDASIPAFRTTAAEKSGVSVSTIDALLQVGKAIDPLPKDVKEALKSCSLGTWMRALRKLATNQFDESREEIITTFAKEDATDPKAARRNLEKMLGLNEKSEAGSMGPVAAKPAPPAKQAEKTTDAEEPQQSSEESFEMPLGTSRVRIVILSGTKDEVQALLKRWEVASVPPAPESGVNVIGAVATAVDG